ncbi:histidine kinase dimerization/phosphoacceptor domain-containing protein [Streptomyces sp. NPDC059272]|uniref:histidine kinase dimerization/phosphoacceptor domain-containing protein n=1 Tax=Streptomyces sp. NPDC059272 TaxID=3346800 RepID=UPI0036C7ECE9
MARDPPDVVAHHVAVINVQVGVAAHPLREQPDAAEEALAHVRQAARTVLAELSIVRGLLCSEEQDAEHASTTESSPGLRAPGRNPARALPAAGVEGLGGFRERCRSPLSRVPVAGPIRGWVDPAAAGPLSGTGRDRAARGR